MPSINKPVVYTTRTAQPSRFLVDLHTLREEKETAELRAMPGWKKLKNRLSRKEEAEVFKQNILTTPEDRNTFKKEKGETTATGKFFGSQVKGNETDKKYKHMLFYPLFQAVFLLVKWLLRLCYYLGWLTVYILRIMALGIGKLLKIINLLGFNRMFRKNRKRDDNDAFEPIVERGVVLPRAEVGSATLVLAEPLDSTRDMHSSILDVGKKHSFSSDKDVKHNHILNMRENINEIEAPVIELDEDLRLILEQINNEDGIKREATVPKHTAKEPERERRRFSIRSIIPWPRLKFIRGVIYFSLFLLVFAMPLKAVTYYKQINDLKGLVLGVSESAAGEMVAGVKSITDSKFNEADMHFSQASAKFSQASAEIGNLSYLFSLMSKIAPHQTTKMAANVELVLDSGKLSAELAQELNLLLSSLESENLKVGQIIDDIYLRSLTIKQLADKLLGNVKAIDPAGLPEEYRGTFLEIQGKTRMLEASLGELVDLVGVLKIFLGFEEDKRYLLVFQNNTEMRASGGFLGSYALIDFQNGEIKNLEVPVGGTYDTEAGLSEKIRSPEPLRLISPRWFMWDANWWPDWPTSAEKIMWFYERSGGPTVDGVIGFTPTVIERMLVFIGPIDLNEEYGLTITSENFWENVQDVVEEKPESEGPDMSEAITEKQKPKKIIGDIMAAIIEKTPDLLGDKDIFLGVIKSLEKSLDEKHILFYLTDEEPQKIIAKYDWNGAIKETAWDYLMVVNSNIAGGKSDRTMQNEIEHKSAINSDGSIINTVTITRAHATSRYDKFRGVRNVNWMRVYVPEGSELIEASGFLTPDEKFFGKVEEDWKTDEYIAATEGQADTHVDSGTKIYKENGKTVFANWTMVDPGQTILITLKYKLPFKASLNSPDKQVPHALLVQKQPGTIGVKIRSELILPESLSPNWQYGFEEGVTPNGWIIEDELGVDKYWAVICS